MRAVYVSLILAPCFSLPQFSFAENLGSSVQSFDNHQVYTVLPRSGHGYYSGSVWTLPVAQTEAGQVKPLAPKAKIVSVDIKGDSPQCQFEAGVCVLRFR